MTGDMPVFAVQFSVAGGTHRNQIIELVCQQVVGILSGNVPEYPERDDVVHVEGAPVIFLLQSTYPAAIAVSLAGLARLSIPVWAVVAFPSALPVRMALAAECFAAPQANTFLVAEVPGALVSCPDEFRLSAVMAMYDDLTCNVFVGTPIRAIVVFMFADLTWGALIRLPAVLAYQSDSLVLSQGKMFPTAVHMIIFLELAWLAHHHLPAYFAGDFNLCAGMCALTGGATEVCCVDTVVPAAKGFPAMIARDLYLHNSKPPVDIDGVSVQDTPYQQEAKISISKSVRTVNAACPGLS